MQPEEELNKLIPFTYSFTEELPPNTPFLLRAARMGCGYTQSTFHVVRECTYPYFTVHFLFDGCSMFHIAGRDYLLKKGDAFVIPAGEAHTYYNYSREPLGLIWIELAVSGCQELLSYFKLHNIYTIDAAHTEKPLLNLILIQNTIKAQNHISDFKLSALYYTFLMDMLETVSCHSQRSLPKEITAALYYIEKHFTEDIQIGQLAGYLHISHTYLTRIFRTYMGTSPLKYINLKKIEYACYLLDHSPLTCEKISEAIGMYDAAHFNHFFRQQLGMSPTAYRRRSHQPVLL